MKCSIKKAGVIPNLTYRNTDLWTYEQTTKGKKKAMLFVITFIYIKKLVRFPQFLKRKGPSGQGQADEGCVTIPELPKWECSCKDREAT